MHIELVIVGDRIKYDCFHFFYIVEWGSESLWVTWYKQQQKWNKFEGKLRDLWMLWKNLSLVVICMWMICVEGEFRMKRENVELKHFQVPPSSIEDVSIRAGISSCLKGVFFLCDIKGGNCNNKTTFAFTTQFRHRRLIDFSLTLITISIITMKIHKKSRS